MKKFYLFLWLCFNLLVSGVVQANESISALELLTKMVDAHKRNNYELLYILQQGENVDSLRYRHSLVNNKQYAQLLHLDSTREEIILRNQTVSYFSYDFQPFSLQSESILDNLPSAYYTNFSAISDYYTIIDTGRDRIADHICRIIRLIPKDQFRHQYTLWVDAENFMLLKSQINDKSNNVLEEFRVIQLYIDDQLTHIAEPINSLTLPTLLPVKKYSNDTPKWRLKWIPSGFKQISSSIQTLAINTSYNEQIENQLYSDGLFSFTVYLVKNTGIIFNEQFWQEGKLSIYSQTIGNNDVIIIGEIPLISAKHIVQEIELSDSLTTDKDK